MTNFRLQTTHHSSMNTLYSPPRASLFSPENSSSRYEKLLRSESKVKYRNKRGFTLIELLVVISIIGLLSSVVLSSLTSARVKARDSKRIQDIVQLQRALELYYQDNGRYPATVDSSQYRIDCWECSNVLFGAYDASKIFALESPTRYLKPRPSDPSVPSSGRFNPPCSICGYFYKVSNSGKDYKITISVMAENSNNIPENMRDWDFLFGVLPSIALYSSDVSKNWSMSTNVSTL
ncbi:MAG: prepilin-type N-terminal cleavage/methylation domain-containing protein [bacterium]|nr:prepilin-type N-terminal cleavage/methylation domain-containing protein [bacterium]